uniref:Hypothetical conserved protein n=1 Tax=uncultured beta proteobacterium TaxID=86027 RepID=H5SEZ4_9PROT|nr:hypothetical conserved protein [uncultured beta proteobacterium]
MNVPYHFDHLINQIQRNCAIADAQYARNQTLCTYLLQMREYYRWAHEIPLGAPLPHREVARWIREQERTWEPLEAEELKPLTWQERTFDPFDEGGLNALLIPIGFVYTAGIGRFGKPHFALAELKQKTVCAGIECWHLGREYARDLSLLPALYREGRIVIRRDALTRVLWEKWELWRSQQEALPKDRALVFQRYRLEDNGCRLETLTEDAATLLVWHEIGEHQAEERLPTEWPQMVAAAGDRANEVVLRTVRDLVADALSVYPRLAEHDAGLLTALHFALTDGLRRQWVSNLTATLFASHQSAHSPQPLRTLASIEADRWLKLANKMRTAYLRSPAQFPLWLRRWRERLHQQTKPTPKAASNTVSTTQ